MRSVKRDEVEGKAVFCGIDLHARQMVAAIAVDRGPIECRTYGTQDMEVGRLVTDLQGKGGARIHVVYEASGEGFCLADILEGEGLKVSVVAPTEVERSVRAKKRKTDKDDARRLVKLVRSHVLADGDLPAVWVPEKGLRDDREVVRRRLQMGEDLTRVKNRVHGLLVRHRIRRPAEVKTLWTQKHRAWLNDLVGTLPAGAGQGLSSLLRELEYFFEERDRMDEALSKLASAPRYESRAKQMQEVPGVGVVTAMVFLTEMGDPTRFANRKRFGSWLGLTPRCHESGEATDRKGHISGMGPARVRKVLNQAAWALMRNDERVAEWFHEQTVHRNKHRKKVIVALMRKLGIVLWHRALAA